MHAAQPPEPLMLSEADYLTFADGQELRYEYVRGRVYAMTGGSVRHSIIIANMIIHLDSRLTGRDCTVTSSDTRIHIASKHTYRYPDVTVFCGEPVYLSGRTDTITNPALLVEVLSPGTVVRDYNEKLEEYTQIASLQAYVLVEQHMPRLEVFRRHEGDKWLYENVRGIEADIAVPLLGIDLGLSLAQVYRRVRWDTDESPTPDAE